MSDDDSTLAALGTSAAVVFAATMLGKAIALLAEVLIVRSLPPSLYGQISYAYSITFALGSVFLFGINEGVTRQYSASDDALYRGRIVAAGFSMALFAGVVAAAGVFLFRARIAQLANAEYLDRLLVLFVPYLLVFPLAKVSFATLRGQKRTLQSVLARQIGGKGVAFVALAVAVLWGRSFYGALAYWNGFPLVMFGLSVLFLARGSVTTRPRRLLPDSRSLVDLWSFSWPLALGSVVFLLLAQLDVLMIGYFLDSDAVGYYRAVQPLKNAAMIALGAFTFLFLPTATERFNEGKSLGGIFTITTKWVLLVTIPLIFTFGFFAGEVTRVFFGAEYLPAAPVLSVLVLGLFFRAVSGLNGDMVKAIDRPRIELYSGAVGLVSNFVLNVVLIKRWGIVGAAAATVVGYVFYNGIELLWIYRLTRATPFSGNIAKVTTSMTAVAAVTAYLSPQRIGLLGLLSVGAFFVIVEAVVLVLTRSVDEADIELIETVESRLDLDLDLVKTVAGKGLKTDRERA